MHEIGVLTKAVDLVESVAKDNGLDHVGSPGMGIDVQSMDRKTRADFRRRIRNGEKINFMDQV